MREKLIKKIIDKPADAKRHQEFAAWLKENDDPLGEFIELQLTMENSGIAREKRFEFDSRERELLEAHGRDWIGPLADFLLTRISGKSYELKPGCRIWWWRGWIQGLQLDELTLKLSKILLNAPEMKLFDKLVLTEPVNASCDYLHEWGLLDKVKYLDLSYGRITDKGALTLAADRSTRKLKSLDLTGNQITEEGQAAIKKTFPKVLLDDQNPIILNRGEDWEETS